MRHRCRTSILAGAIFFAVVPVALSQQTPKPTGLDAFDDKRVMTELANRGMRSLLRREFQLYDTPPAEQTTYLTLLAIHQLSDPDAHLTLVQRQDLIKQISGEIRSALPLIREPSTLLQIAKTLVTEAVEPQVNALEYWGENGDTQAQMRPLIQIVLAVYDRAAIEAAKTADEIANHLVVNDDAGAKRWQVADDLHNLAIFSGNMAKYDLCLSMDHNDPERVKTADTAIDSLKQFDTNESAVQAVVRIQTAKLNMAKGDYAAAREIFETIINNTAGQIKPPPDGAQQFEARYFSAVCQLLSHDLDGVRKSMDELAVWQKVNLSAQQQPGASAAFAMLQYRTLSEQADQAGTADERAKDNEEAIDTLMQLLKDQPQYRTVIFQQVMSRLPPNPDLLTLDPLLLLAIQQQGVQEELKSGNEKVNTDVIEHAVAAAREIVNRQQQGADIDAVTASRSAYVIPYLLDRLGRTKEAAGAFIDFAQNFPTDTKNANDALDHATMLIGELRKKDLQDPETRKLYDRFLPLAIGSPYDRTQFAFEYGVLLQREQKYKQAIEYFQQVPADDNRNLSAHFFEMVALKQRLNDDDEKIESGERGQIMSQIQKLADEVNNRASADAAKAKSDDEKKRFTSMLVRTALLAADLANREQSNPKRCLEMLSGFETKVQGMPKEQDLLFEALSLRVNAYMSLGQTTDATDALVQLLKTKQGNEGPALVFDLLKKLDADMDRAKAAGDEAQVRQLAQNRAALSGFLVTWAAENSDPKIKAMTARYKVFDASTKELAAELNDDPAAKKAGLEAALKLYSDLYDPANADPVVAYGVGSVQFDLGNYKAAKEALGPLVVNKKLGTALTTITENGEAKTVENTQYWDGVLKLLRSTAETARQNPDDAAAQTDLASAKLFLKQLYVQWPKTIGGKKFHDDFEQLREQIVPDFNPQGVMDAAAPTGS